MPIEVEMLEAGSLDDALWLSECLGEVIMVGAGDTLLRQV